MNALRRLYLKHIALERHVRTLYWLPDNVDERRRREAARKGRG